MGTILKLILSKGYYSTKTKQELRILFSTRCPILLYIFTKFHKNILDGIKVIEQTKFSLEIFQRGIVSQNCRLSYSSCSLHIV